METNNLQTNNQQSDDKFALEIFKQLPESIQKAITNSGWETRIRRFVDEYRLRVDQGTVLENMTFGLMLGQVDSDEYYETILKEFGLENAKANALFKDIDEQVFGHIQKLIVASDKKQEDAKQEKVPGGITSNSKPIGEKPKAPSFSATPKTDTIHDKSVPSMDDVMKGIEDQEEKIEGVTSVPPLPGDYMEINKKPQTPDFSKGSVPTNLPENKPVTPSPTQNIVKPAPKKVDLNDVPPPPPINVHSDSVSQGMSTSSVVDSADSVPTRSADPVALTPKPSSIVPPKPDLTPGHDTTPPGTFMPQKSENNKSFTPDPVSVGLGSNIDTMVVNRNYGKDADPYREPIN